ncbi:hypothetical protein KOI35_28320 [Actinoplanes bogorensis]|uniref:Uncharacterized protein n=1 Tax=Paractinoplanes bogorensis TaxID=1610840 RepID=A0ABS5YVE6_9ACTN|nr:hypothetical protein [Actinoplanes bogorensis]MBU2667423.1 hypothetical protein [Actinoplanes bogorensis]
MLSDEERILLAPHLALLRRAHADLVAAEEALQAADQDRARSAGESDWRDRLLGGLFSADDGRAKRFRQARDSRKAADTTLAEARERYGKYADRVNGMLEPMLVRDDPVIKGLVAAVRACDDALRACQQLSTRIASGVAKPAPKQREQESWHEAEFGRQRLTELVGEVRAAGPGLRKKVERAAKAVGMPVPAVPETGNIRTLGPGADQGLREVSRQLDGLAAELARWRKGADTARAAALRAAHDRL